MSTTILETIKQIIDETLGLGERRTLLTAETRLLNHLPELDSLAVVQLALAIERRFDLAIPDEDFGGELFASVGSLACYVEARVREPDLAVAMV